MIGRLAIGFRETRRVGCLASSSPAVGRAGRPRGTPGVGLPRHWRC
ncbi:hypothetical protein ALC56_06013 [Trachymyrmex septentrionalis]|uniref:Uncharacterized protein n=1 Tax=Trachymyrmex septentrionalis TaxID=34720 RepID=A0A195FFP3_9HYME|nr:hypothetical protein ALC56_06013 [Trachymyrmex septentrionalis]